MKNVMFGQFFKAWIFCVMIFFKEFQIISGVRDYDIQLRAVSYKFLKPEIVDKFDIVLLPSKGHNVIHLETILRLPVKTFQLQITSRVMHTNKKLMDITLNGCDMITNAYNNKNFGKILMTALSYGNSSLPTKCPLEPKKLYVMDRFYLDPEQFPTFMPDMNIVNTVNLITSNTLIVSVAVNISVVRSSI